MLIFTCVDRMKLLHYGTLLVTYAIIGYVVWTLWSRIVG